MWSRLKIYQNAYHLKLLKTTTNKSRQRRLELQKKNNKTTTTKTSGWSLSFLFILHKKEKKTS